jgi:citrate lyase subunit beta/citryl-CoA lyase
VTTELNDPDVVRDDARRARSEFGFLRMWSIHPRQIQPIVEAMRPDFAEVTEAAGILLAAQNADWGPIAWEGKLHDRASYRYYWELLRRAHATGAALPAEARHVFQPRRTTIHTVPTDSNERTSPCLKPIANTSPNAPPSASRPCP